MRDDKTDKRQVHAVTLMTLAQRQGARVPARVHGGNGGRPPAAPAFGCRRRTADRRGTAPVLRGRDARAGHARSHAVQGAHEVGQAPTAIPSRFLMEMRGETDRAQRIAEASSARHRSRTRPRRAKPTAPQKKRAAKTAPSQANRRKRGVPRKPKRSRRPPPPGNGVARTDTRDRKGVDVCPQHLLLERIAASGSSSAVSLPPAATR